MLSALKHRHAILGINARNLLYLHPYNPAKAVALADDKMKTKAFLSARGVPVAKVFARIEDREQLLAFDFAQLPDECVLKPNYGYGGEGILVLRGRRNGVFLERGKQTVTERRLREHIEDILDGRFSVNGKRDTAFFEKILTAHSCFAPFRPAGLPDIRLVVFNLVPVMAMLRIPTRLSGGKANVHQGGIGVGIDIARGITTHAFQYSRSIPLLPHGMPPGGFQLPFWDEMLLIASRIQALTNIGYLAVDLTIDREQGPTLLEVNARAGLSVQIANLAPLRTRLERVRGVAVGSPEKGVRLAKDLFGVGAGAGTRGAGAGSGGSATGSPAVRPVLAMRETILVQVEGGTMEVPCLAAPMLGERTVFTRDLLAQLADRGGAERREDGAYLVKFTLAGRKMQTLVQPGSAPLMSVRAVLGRKDLKEFLIDPAKRAGTSLVRHKIVIDLRAFDRALAEADEALVLLKLLKPVNLAAERARLESDASYSPFFAYPELPPHVDELERRLTSFPTDDSPLGVLLAKKRRELLQRIALLRARGDAERFTAASRVLFGGADPPLLRDAESVLRSRTACDLPPPASELLDAAAVAPLFEEALERYGLHDWQVHVRPSIVADCTVGWKELYLREGVRFSREHVAALILHEVETHVLAVENGAHQPYELFRRGFAGYLETQEGLAVLNQNRVLSPFHEKRFGPARSVLAAAHALTHSFVDTRRYLVEELGYAPTKSLTKAIELKRGLHDASVAGGFTKGVVYFRGQRAVERFVERGGDLRRLYIGRIALQDLELAEQVPGVQPPLLLPEFLQK